MKNILEHFSLRTDRVSFVEDAVNHRLDDCKRRRIFTGLKSLVRGGFIGSLIDLGLAISFRKPALIGYCSFAGALIDCAQESLRTIRLYEPYHSDNARYGQDIQRK
jgi:hypothetical protein